MLDPEVGLRAEIGRALVEYRPWLMKLVRRWFRDTRRLSGADLVQETLLDAVRDPEWALNNCPGRQRSWLRKVLWRKVVDALRHQTRGKRDLSRVQSLQASGLAERLADDRPTPDAHVDQAELATRVAAAVAVLTPPQREALRLRFWEDLTLAGIAGRSGRSIASVGQLVSRGLNGVQAQLDPPSKRNAPTPRLRRAG